MAWIGLAGGTGGAFENHDILAWSFTSQPLAVPERADLALTMLAGVGARCLLGSTRS